jgi:hypothetical protein
LSHDWIPDINFFHLLDAEDARVAAAVKATGCPHCGGRLDRADYPRKPRGGEMGAGGEAFERRRSLCCSRGGCRRRKTPPSLVFLGRRVYLAMTVVMSAWRAATTTRRSPPARTVRRWRAWFAELRDTDWWVEAGGRLWPAVEPTEVLPAAIIERLWAGRSLAEALGMTLRILTPAPVVR